MAECPICKSRQLQAFRTRWWEKVQGELVWRRECQCAACGWFGWLTGSAKFGHPTQVHVVEAHESN